MPNTYSDTPIASHTLAADQPTIEANFLYLADALGTTTKSGDHQISVGGVDTNSFEGRHLQVCLSNRHGAAPTVAGIGDGTNSLLYSDNGNVFFGSATGAGAFQLTTYNAGANFGGNAAVGGSTNAGWIFLPGALILQYGQIASPGAGPTAITYPIAFPTRTFSVQLTPRNDGSHSSFNYYLDGAPTTTGFTYRGTTSGSNTLFWMAIGN